MTTPIIDTRDYSSEMNDFINSRLHIANSAPALARIIVNELLEEDEDLFNGWLALHALELVRKAIGDRHRSERSRNRTIALREPVLKAKMQVAAAQASVGNLRPAAELSTELNVNKTTKFLAENYIQDGEFISLGEMRRPHRQRVAAYHQTMGRAHLIRRAFILAIDERCGEEATGDVYTEEELSTLWRKLNGIKENDDN